MAGTLYVVATPIGNLEDITLRALRILGEAQVIAAEDTRSAQHLLERHGIAAAGRVQSYFEGNEAERAPRLVEKMLAGEDVALISEAGTPGVSDPGHRLIVRAIEAGLVVVPIPGPSAAIAALIASGLPTEAFHFVGFPPRESGPRKEAFGRLRAETATMIFYEAPGRTAATLADLSSALGATRRACVARELTKIHEELRRATLAELAAHYAQAAPRGEVTILVEGAREGALVEIDVEQEIKKRLAAGESAKEIAAALALATGKPRRMIYQLVVARAGKR